MARILIATVPLSGHVNPGLPIAQRLVAHGHEVVWYCGRHFEEVITGTGARFSAFNRAREFNDQQITQLFGKVPTYSLLAHAGFYIRKVFYDPMPAYYADLLDVLKEFDADIILSDEWFSGGIPFSELKIKPWVIYGNSPLMMFSKNAPAPGSGLLPAGGLYGKNRDRIVNFIARILLSPIQDHINGVRKKVGLPKLQYFFPEQNIRKSTLTLKFNTPIFEFPHKNLPKQIRFVGPVLPEVRSKFEFPWMEQIEKSSNPTIFITQGSVDIYDIRKLIIPALKALCAKKMNIIVSTGGKDTMAIRKAFPQEHIIVENFIPYDLIMRNVTIMITNGGYGGVSTALCFGVPVIIAGNSEDKPEIASRLRYSGAGVDLQTGRPSPRLIKKAVHAILNNPKYKEKALAVMKDFNTHDAVAESVQLLEELFA